MTLDKLAQLFANVSACHAEGYATGFHAGIAAVLRQVAGEFLEQSADYTGLMQALEELANA